MSGQYKWSCILFLPLLLQCMAGACQQMPILKGVISSPYDNSIILSAIQIKSSSGQGSTADRSGKYQIAVSRGDTIKFYYKQRLIDVYFYTNKVANPTYNVTIIMDESAQAHELATVKVYGKGYKEDSLARRKRYEDLYNYKDARLSMGNNKWSESVDVMGEKMQLNTMDKKVSLMDVQSLAKVFSFKKRKRRKRDQRFALASEQMAYIRHRMSKNQVEKYGHIHDDDSLDVFIQRYAPTYEDLKKMSDFELFQYIIVQARLFKKGLPAQH